MARVEETNADVYLHDRATIFAYNPASRMLLWAKHNGRDRNWELHKNGIKISQGRPPHTSKDASMTTHYEMFTWARAVQPNVGIPLDSSEYIRGRIAPDHNTLYIHDLKSRHCNDDIRLGFDRHVKWALKKVGMYMKSEKSGVIKDAIKKREITRMAERWI